MQHEYAGTDFMVFQIRLYDIVMSVDVVTGYGTGHPSHTVARVACGLYGTQTVGTCSVLDGLAGA